MVAAHLARARLLQKGGLHSDVWSLLSSCVQIRSLPQTLSRFLPHPQHSGPQTSDLSLEQRMAKRSPDSKPTTTREMFRNLLAQTITQTIPHSPVICCLALPQTLHPHSALRPKQRSRHLMVRRLLSKDSLATTHVGFCDSCTLQYNGEELRCSKPSTMCDFFFRTLHGA
jgi:hypothetical protein